MAQQRDTLTRGKVVDDAMVQKLKEGLHGALLRSGDETYDEARRVFNAMIDRRPDVIVRCAETSDVVNCVNLARANDLLIAIRGGGHNVAGTGVCDGGILLDLSTMKGIRVDPERRTARAQPGLLVGEFDRET